MAGTDYFHQRQDTEVLLAVDNDLCFVVDVVVACFDRQEEEWDEKRQSAQASGGSQQPEVWVQSFRKNRQTV